MTAMLVLSDLQARRFGPALRSRAQGAGRGIALLLVIGLAVTSPVLAQDADPATTRPYSPPVTSDVPEAASSASSPGGDGLLPISSALLTNGRVQVAGSIDRGSVREEQVDGAEGYGFELYDAAGGRLRVVSPDALPIGFESFDAAVVDGSMQDGRLIASQILIPGTSGGSGSSLGLTGVMVITLIVWVGLFLYMFRVDRMVHRMEVT